MKIDINIVKGLKLVNIGYIEADAFNADKCYDLFNWSRWSKVKPKNLFADIEGNHRVCFTNPETNEMWLAKSVGWLHGSEEDIIEYIKENENSLLWL